MGPTVQELIHMRLADKSSAPGQRNDPYKLAIAAEDGSMLWVVAAGFMSRLEAHGIQADMVVGTSGGGLAAAYYSLGQTRHGSMSLRHLNRKGLLRDGTSRRFIDPRRLLTPEPVMDIEALVDDVFTDYIPMSMGNYASHGIPTYMTAVTRTGEVVLQPLHGQSPAAVKLALKNTARVPFIAHNVRDTSVLWDGGLRASIPVQQALELGATHVLVVRCKDNVGPTRLGRYLNVEELLVKPVLAAKAPDLAGLLRQRNDYIAAALGLTTQGFGHIATLAIPKVDIGYAEDDEGRLFTQLVKAWHHAGNVLGLPAQPLPQHWAAETAMYL